MSVPTIPLIQKRPDVNDKQLEFWWSAPVSDGGAPITSYILSDTGNSLSYTLPVTDYYNLTGLTNGTTYSFTLAASNANGLGETAFFTPVQPGIEPGPPSLVSATAVGSNGYQLVFTNPSDLGSNTRLLGTLLTGIPLDANSNLSTNSSLYIYRSLEGGLSGALQTAFITLTNQFNYRILLEAVNDPGYSLTKVYTSTLVLLPPTAFSPSSLAGINLWLDATDVSTFVVSSATSTITRWNDKSGAGNNMLASGTPILSTNFVYFNGTNAYFSTIGMTEAATTSMFIYLQEGGSGFLYTSKLGNGAGESHTGFTPNDAGNYYLLRGDGVWQTASGLTSNTLRMVGLQYQGSVNTSSFNSTITLFSNASTFVTTTQSAAITRTRFNLGARLITSYTNFYTGRMYEVLHFSTSLATLQRQTAEGYLAWKWGLSTLLPTTHPFYTRAPLASDSNLDFSPSSITGANLWLDANDLTTFVVSSATSTITRWNDKSGAGNNMIATGTPTIQSFITNYAVNFNGTNAYFSSIGFTEPAVTTLIVYNQGGGKGWLYTTKVSGASVSGVTTNYGDSFTYLNIGDNAWGSTPVWANNVLRMVGTQYNGAVNSTIVLYSNANVTSTFTQTSTITRDRLLLGARQLPGYNEYYAGNFFEVLNFSTVLSLQQRQQAEGYLAWKWGLQANLPSTHLYYFRPPTRKDIFTSFSPSSVTGLEVWIDAQDATTLTLTGGSNITEVRDKSSNGYIFSNATGFTYNASTFNTSYPSFYNGTSGGNRHLGSNTQILENQPMTVFTVARAINTNWANLFDAAIGNTRMTIYNDQDLGGRQGMFAGSVLTAPTNYFLNSNTIMDFYFSTTNSLMFVNGNTTAVQSGTVGTNSLSTLIIGNHNAVTKTQNWNGHICEMLFFTGPLPLRDRQNVEGYLAWKWGLQSNLPSTHPFRYSSTISLGPISTVNTF